MLILERFTKLAIAVYKKYKRSEKITTFIKRKKFTAFYISNFIQNPSFLYNTK